MLQVIITGKQLKKLKNSQNVPSMKTFQLKRIVYYTTLVEQKEWCIILTLVEQKEWCIILTLVEQKEWCIILTLVEQKEWCIILTLVEQKERSSIAAASCPLPLILEEVYYTNTGRTNCHVIFTRRTRDFLIARSSFLSRKSSDLFKNLLL